MTIDIHINGVDPQAHATFFNSLIIALAYAASSQKIEPMSVTPPQHPSQEPPTTTTARPNAPPHAAFSGMAMR